MSQAIEFESKSLGRTLGRWGIYAMLFVFALYYIAPLIIMVSTSLKDIEEIRSGSLISLPKSVTFDAWRVAWGEACIGVDCRGLAPYLMNSLLLVVPTVVISTLLGALNGFALTKVRFRGANIIFAMMLFGCFIPFQVVILPMAQTLGLLGLVGDNSTYGLILVHIVYGVSFTTLFFRNYYVGIPDELVQAATIDGAGFFTVFWRIMLPLSPSIIVVAVIWQFTQIWNDFLFGATFTAGPQQPLTVALNNLVNTSTGVKLYNVDMAGAIIAALPTLVVYFIAGKYFVRGLTAGAVKG